MNSDTPLSIVIKAKDIPNGFTVTKLTGNKPYKIYDNLSYYGAKENGLSFERIQLDSGTKVLVPFDADKNLVIINGEKELFWQTTAHELKNFLNQTIREY